MKLPQRFLKLLVLPIVTIGSMSAALSQSYTVNVRDLGAIGNGVADDTLAFQNALNVTGGAFGSDIYVPPGNYRITQTLLLDRKATITLRGQGRSNGYSVLAPAATTLTWDGTAGGTLLKTVGVRTCTIRDLNLEGNSKAGILLLYISINGWGNILNRISNISFANATTGLQFGDDTSLNICNSDVKMDFLFFAKLTNGMMVKNSQGVDYLIDHMFGSGCGTVLDFEKGGNLTVNNAQLTDCDLFLNIVSSGIGCGSFVANTVRVESSDGGSVKRPQLLKAAQSNPAGSTPCNITFTGFTDAQLSWRSNTTVDRFKPLYEIGPEASVTFQGSIFNSPVAQINGSSVGDAYLVTRECAFIIGTPMSPGDFCSANQYGYFQLLNSRNKYKQIVGDVTKWKATTPLVITTPSYTGQGFVNATIP